MGISIPVQIKIATDLTKKEVDEIVDDGLEIPGVEVTPTSATGVASKNNISVFFETHKSNIRIIGVVCIFLIICIALYLWMDSSSAPTISLSGGAVEEHELLSN
jgi:hypothetical protein